MSHPFSDRPELIGIEDGMFCFSARKMVDAPILQRAAGLARIVQLNSKEKRSLWGDFLEFLERPLSALASFDPVAQEDVAGLVAQTPLTHGFLQGHVVTNDLRNSPGSRMHVGRLILDRFYRLGEATGALRVRSAEHGQLTIEVRDLEPILSRIEDRIGIDLSEPCHVGGMWGLRIRDRVFTERHFDAIYAAWRARGLVRFGGRPSSLLEIGGGAGLLAYYARLFGFERVGIVDIPHPRLVQYLVVATAFGVNRVTIDSAPQDGIGLFLSGPSAPDFAGWSIVVNVDGLPEMPAAAAEAYLRSVVPGQTFLSINQEAGVAKGVDDQVLDQGVVAELASRAGLKLQSRAPAWLRTGYVEEVYARP